ncbi:MAG: mechanosensitive ion channel [Anaerolineae bacterium]
MDSVISQLTGLVGGSVLNVVAAILILLVGWFIASLLAGAVRAGLKRTSLDNRLAKALGAQDAQALSIEEWISKGIFYLIMLFVVVAALEAMQLTVITQPLNAMLNQVLAYAPRLLSAGILLLVAWLLGTIVRKLILKLAETTHLDQRLSQSSGGNVSIAKTIGDIVYYLIFLFFLPAILDALSLQGLLTPVQGMVDKVLAFLPNLVAAVAIFVIGWFIAGIIRKIVTGLLAAIGLDALSERVGIASALGQQKLSGLLGLFVFVLMIVPVFTAALDALQLQAVTAPVSNVLNTILGALPNILAAVIVLAFSYVIGRVIASFVTEILKGMNFDAVPARLGLGKLASSSARTPSAWAGWLVLAAIMLFAAIEAARLLGLTMVSALVEQFTVLAGQVIFGLLLFAVGLWLANLAADVVEDTSVANARLFGMATRVAILVLVGAMALRAMGIANDIVNLAFSLLLGAVAVAVAIAFGFGGRETAAHLLARWEQSLSSEKAETAAPATAPASESAGPAVPATAPASPADKPAGE